LNVENKIVSRSTSTHLLKVFHFLVGKDQTCGVPGRFISENVALICVVDYYSLSDVHGALNSLDQEKAFGRVDWYFNSLVSMGFGPSFIK